MDKTVFHALALILSSLEKQTLRDDSGLSSAARLEPRRSRSEVLKLFPRRPVVDFLIQHYLSNINWLFERIHPPTFSETYRTWWSKLSDYNDEDIQFGVFVLRICCMSVQFLPHPDWPTDGLFDVSLDAMESRCNAAACKLDSYQPRSPSSLRIEQLLLYVSTLVNSGNTAEAYAILAESVKEGQEINLFLEEKWPPMSEFDKEMLRKTYWNLFMWDR